MTKSIEQKLNDAMCLFSEYCSDNDIEKLNKARSEIIGKRPKTDLVI